jgi:membrane protease YdiL (CAAX protease family)
MSAIDDKAPVWTLVGLAVAILATPLVVGLFTALQVPLTPLNVLLREIALFGLAIVLAVIIRRRERLGWDSVGLRRVGASTTLLWVLIAIVGVLVAGSLAFGVIRLLGVPLDRVDSAAYDALPVSVLLIVIIRAGFVEELFYRGYAIERLGSLTGSRSFSAGVPLLVFAVSHYRQGWAGVIIALLTGAVLTGIYLYKRNLWTTITTHFLVDFIPNILMPLFVTR